MTYWQFHVVFMLPALALAAFLPPRPLDGATRRTRVLFLGLIALIAFVYTTPWDNYLVYRGVWSYGTERVLGVIGYVPIEEYVFFLLQPLLTGLVFYRLLDRSAGVVQPVASWWPNLLGGLGGVALGGAGYVAMQAESGLYMGLILVWAAPVLAGQWAYAGRAIWARWRPCLMGILIPTLYLWAADRIAIGLGVWEIAERYTVGWFLVGLPVEEALFFLVTNILVVQGLVLFLFPPK